MRNVTHRAVWVLAVVALSGVIRLARLELDGVPSPVMAAWPGQVIFGFYFTILVLAIQGLHGHRTPGASGTPEQRLLLLAMAGVCLDLVLVNVAETIGRVDASYGVVVLWDIVTFFVWMRAVEVGRPGEALRFERSATVAVAPALKLGRELLFVPYGSASARAYFQLSFTASH
ncbi:MAG: hypothetical protein HYY76_16690 [Acidobacteria bacterium]|nr:hypothetical protein [Acidobacteriota bacterium]